VQFDSVEPVPSAFVARIMAKQIRPFFGIDCVAAPRLDSVAAHHRALATSHQTHANESRVG
jgi:hypothetical protein